MSEVDQGRRRGFLAFAVFLANAFLVAFVVDAVSSIMDDAMLLAPTDSVFFGVRGLLGLLVLALALVMLFAVIFVPHLPKLVLVPPIIVIFWQTLGAPPIVWSFADRASWLPLDAIELASAVAAVLVTKVTTGHWFLAASRLPRKAHLVLRTLIAIPVSLVVVAVLASGVVIAGVAVFLQEQTKGYLQFTSAGIEVRETVMRKDDKLVHLVATVHFADPQFYHEVYSTIPADALILAEGVTDREGRVKHGLAYGNVAQTLGLETQDVFERLIGPATEADEPAQAGGGTAAKSPTPGRPPSPKLRPDVVRADVDVADFAPLTTRFIARVGEVYSSRSFGEAVQRLSAVSSEFSNTDVKSVMDDLIHKRNAKVLAEFDKRLAHYTTVFIPWGAQHMPDLEAALKERGFKIVSQRMIPLARYQTICDAFWAQARRAEAGVRVLADGAP